MAYTNCMRVLPGDLNVSAQEGLFWGPDVTDLFFCYNIQLTRLTPSFLSLSFFSFSRSASLFFLFYGQHSRRLQITSFPLPPMLLLLLLLLGPASGEVFGRGEE